MTVLALLCRDRLDRSQVPPPAVERRGARDRPVKPRDGAGLLAIALAAVFAGMPLVGAGNVRAADATNAVGGADAATNSKANPSAQSSPRRQAKPRAQAGPMAEFVSALQQGRTNEAFALLDRISENDAAGVRTLSQAGEALAEVGWPERGLPYAERAHRKAPHDMAVAHAWIRTQLLARTNLSDPLVARTLPEPSAIPAEHRFFTDAPKFPDDSQTISRRRLLLDLDALEVVLANAYSYADRRGADWRSALDSLRASLGDRVPVETFAHRISRFLTLFGDPHTAVRASLPGFVPAGSAAFLPVDHGGRVLALKPDRTAFLDPALPYLTAIDGRPLADWLKAAAYDVPKASPHWERRQTVAGLGRIGLLRAELGRAGTNAVTLTLASEDGARQRDLVLPWLAKPARASRWPAGDTRKLEGNFGYLRIRSMDSDPKFLAQLDESMAAFRDTRGLVIDVRGNGGGSQDAIRTLLPYFLEPGAPRKIINVAAYRLPVRISPPCAEGYLGLAGRGLHPVTSRVWSEAERTQIQGFLQGFQSSWKLPAGKFSDWHVMGIRAADNPKAYPYTNEVVVLGDAGCFSATDNFLGALQGLPRVTLMGTTSGGGSGRMTSFTLPNSRVPLTVCQMASFRANGDIFDGRGVAPDVVVEPKPEDYLKRQGALDSVLEAALKRLSSGVNR